VKYRHSVNLLAQKLGKPIVILQIMMKPTSRAFKKGVCFTAAEVFFFDIGGVGVAKK
jgi:hypothetical protein